jgi:HAD superfamily hydrolase (TIGR01509 family)
MKAIIFDMDGVLIDSEPFHFRLERELFDEVGIDMSIEEHESFVGTTDYFLWKTLKERHNLDYNVEELVEKKKMKIAKNIDKIPLMDHILEFILFLKENGFKLALASSNNRFVVESIVNHFNLDRHLEVILSGEDVSKGKPDPEIFLTAATKLGVPYNNCIVIEDATNGIRAAKKANMACIAIKNPNSGNQDLSQADLIISGYKDLTLEKIEHLLNK